MTKFIISVLFVQLILFKVSDDVVNHIDAEIQDILKSFGLFLTIC